MGDDEIVPRSSYSVMKASDDTNDTVGVNWTKVEVNASVEDFCYNQLQRMEDCAMELSQISLNSADSADLADYSIPFMVRMLHFIYLLKIEIKFGLDSKIFSNFTESQMQTKVRERIESINKLWDTAYYHYRLRRKLETAETSQSVDRELRMAEEIVKMFLSLDLMLTSSIPPALSENIPTVIQEFQESKKLETIQIVAVTQITPVTQAVQIIPITQTPVAVSRSTVAENDNNNSRRSEMVNLAKVMTMTICLCLLALVIGAFFSGIFDS